MTATTLQNRTPGPVALKSPHIARLVSVTGNQAVAALDTPTRGQMTGTEQRVHVGSVIRIATPGSSVIGCVTGMSVPAGTLGEGNDEVRLLELDLVGEIARDLRTGNRSFKRGITSLPSLGDGVSLAGVEDLIQVYSAGGQAAVTIGQLSQNAGIPAQVMLDDLLGKHFAIVGTTGSGKSCAIAGLLQQVLKEHESAHIVVLDMHNEYATAFGSRAELINPSNLYLPFWLMTRDEIVDVLVSEGEDRDTEVAILFEAILLAKRRFAEGASRAASAIRKAADGQALVSLDTPMPFRLSDLIAYIDEQLGKLDRLAGTLPLRRLKSRIELLTIDPRYAFMFGGVTVQDDMAEVLGRIFRVPTDGRPVTVMDLSMIPPEMLNVVVSIICRMTFDLGVWSTGQLPITLICEEAHRYAPVVGNTEFNASRREIARIAKEGRKYGISLGLVTQRPSEIDPTILSQCNTMFAMRLTTEGDQNVVAAAATDETMNLLQLLPSLGDSEAIVLGQAVPIPMRIKFTQLDPSVAPRSKTARFSVAWRNETMTPDALQKVVDRWRLSKRDKA